MFIQAVPTPSLPAPPESDPVHAPPLARLELSERQVFGLAFVLHAHFQHTGPPSTPLQEELAGLRDFLIDLLRERHVDVLLGCSA